MLGKALAKVLAKDNIGVYTIHPGMVKTNLAQNAGWLSKKIFMMMAGSLERGAHTHIAVLEKDNPELQPGGYYAKSKLAPSTSESCNIENARKLMAVLSSYVKDRTTTKSPILDL